jgi:hypothetical protein
MGDSGAPGVLEFGLRSLLDQRTEMPTFTLDLPPIVALPPLFVTLYAMMMFLRHQRSAFVRVRLA